ncbi:prepilin peptidase [Rubellimicrobium aerolatum]|uniref:Prepilin peptidase n=1 Tax=Rubellimicrobium aerolatum TaxID=490979 RepID=A0ABW0SCT0_9RHOB|nr:prepilin peptidase [Rubellimicrobium aerolatum]MBP1806165.1 prepilin signal peptidase PulO-like enzyme (type II secretory pathway) [Rubellimicrobium aerolatum]
MTLGPFLLPAIALAHGASLAVAAGVAEPRRVALGLCLVPALVWLSATDLRRGEIPDESVAIIALAGLGFQWHRLGLGLPLLAEAAAAALATGLLWLAGGLHFRRTGEEALGIGDAKLIGAGTLAVGAASLWALVLVAALGGIAAGLLARRRAGPDAAKGIPFGPFLAYSILVLTLFPIAGPVST